MKFNKWTVGLAAVGLVSLSSAARRKQSATVLTALSSTTLPADMWMLRPNGIWEPETTSPRTISAAEQQGGQLQLERRSKSRWINPSMKANGLPVTMSTCGWDRMPTLWLPNPSIRLARLTSPSVRPTSSTPAVGNGIDWKIGQFDTVIGYESLASPTTRTARSYGFTIEPTSHTGILGTYEVCDTISLTAGVANTFGPVINEKAQGPNPSSSTMAGLTRPTWLRLR